jgi:hypothetical protein
VEEQLKNKNKSASLLLFLLRSTVKSHWYWILKSLHFTIHIGIMLHVGFLFGFLFGPEDGGSRFFRNLARLLEHTTIHSRK